MTDKVALDFQNKAMDLALQVSRIFCDPNKNVFDVADKLEHALYRTFVDGYDASLLDLARYK